MRVMTTLVLDLRATLGICEYFLLIFPEFGPFYSFLNYTSVSCAIVRILVDALIDDVVTT